MMEQTKTNMRSLLNKGILFITFLGLLSFSEGVQPEIPPYKNPNLSIEKRVAD